MKVLLIAADQPRALWNFKCGSVLKFCFFRWRSTAATRERGLTPNLSAATDSAPPPGANSRMAARVQACESGLTPPRVCRLRERR